MQLQGTVNIRKKNGNRKPNYDVGKSQLQCKVEKLRAGWEHVDLPFLFSFRLFFSTLQGLRCLAGGTGGHVHCGPPKTPRKNSSNMLVQ